MRKPQMNGPQMRDSRHMIKQLQGTEQNYGVQAAFYASSQYLTAQKVVHQLYLQLLQQQVVSLALSQGDCISASRQPCRASGVLTTVETTTMIIKKVSEPSRTKWAWGK